MISILLYLQSTSSLLATSKYFLRSEIKYTYENLARSEIKYTFV
jgi:hypothetical protein